MKSIKMCGVQVHYPYEPYPQQINITQVVVRSCSRLQNGAVEVPTGCGKTMALLCSSLGYIVDQRYRVLESMSSDDSIWSTLPRPGDPAYDSSPEPSVINPPPEVKVPEKQLSATTPADAASVPKTPGNDAAPVSAVSKDAPSCQCASSSGASDTVTPTSRQRYARFKFSNDVDYDDFVSPELLTKQARKRARTEQCASCQSSCAEAAAALGKANSHSVVTNEMNTCNKPLTDIEDTVLPKIDGATPTKPPRENGSPKTDFKGGGDADGDSCVVVEPETRAEPDVIYVSSGEDEDDDDNPSQAFTEYSTQEFLSQTFFDEERGETVSLGLDTTVSRQSLRSTLSQRNREPTPGGEFGPTRNYMRNLRGHAYRIPKIYYASRTHLQLDQVVNEIKRTPYCDARVVVLSSREHTCINDNTFRYGKWSNRTEMCHELLSVEQSQKSCCFFRNANKYDQFSKLESVNIGPVIDMYSLIKAGRRFKFCPYFTARNLVATADIILCPVNYLIDPIIRNSMNISLKGEIIIIDEAHMLEDICRDTASLILSVKNLQECYEECTKLVQMQELPGAHQTMANFFSTLKSWIEVNSKKAVTVGFGREKEFSLPSCQLTASFNLSNMTNETLTNFVDCYKKASQHKNKVFCDEGLNQYVAASKVISSKTETLCEHLALILDLVFKHPEDYVGSVTLSDGKEMDVGMPTQSRSDLQWSMKLVCQNPALIFDSLSSITRSIIFSSATLNPMSAFAAELGVQLPNTAIKGHVIPPPQTWIGCLPRGKNGKQLYGVYNTAKTLEYMDEIGSIVLDICQRVPYGVLVFVTSYRTLNKMVERWQETGIWTKIGEHKRPFQESRKAKDFNDILKSFYQTVEAAQEAIPSGLTSVGTGCTGPLLMAVMRGKVSEGFNFADDKTRAIITVGIPYPNIHEDAVRWKREYNKIHTKRNLQDAEGWYNTQAFRALSQSLGRGLRHRQDWCLLLLLEARLQQPKYFQLLPEWMYKRMLLHHQYSGMLNSIEEFIKEMSINSAR